MTMEQIIFNYQNMLSHIRRAVLVEPSKQSIAAPDPLKCVVLDVLTIGAVLHGMNCDGCNIRPTKDICR